MPKDPADTPTPELAEDGPWSGAQVDLSVGLHYLRLQEGARQSDRPGQATPTFLYSKLVFHTCEFVICLFHNHFIYKSLC